MARNSTPATRAYARDKAVVIGLAEGIIYRELRDLGKRMLTSRVAPVVIVLAVFALFGLAVGLVESINL